MNPVHGRAQRCVCVGFLPLALWDSLLRRTRTVWWQNISKEQGCIHLPLYIPPAPCHCSSRPLPFASTGQVGYDTVYTLYQCVYYCRTAIKLCAGRVFDGPLVQTDFRNRQTRPGAQVESTIVNVVFRDKICSSMAFDQIVTY